MVCKDASLWGSDWRSFSGGYGYVWFEFGLGLDRLTGLCKLKELLTAKCYQLTDRPDVTTTEPLLTNPSATTVAFG